MLNYLQRQFRKVIYMYITTCFSTVRRINSTFRLLKSGHQARLWTIRPNLGSQARFGSSGHVLAITSVLAIRSGLGHHAGFYFGHQAIFKFYWGYSQHNSILAFTTQLSSWLGGVVQAVEHSAVRVWILKHGGSILHGRSICSLDYFAFQSVVHNWFTKGCGICCPVCGKVHIKAPLLLMSHWPYLWRPIADDMKINVL